MILWRLKKKLKFLRPNYSMRGKLKKMFSFKLYRSNILITQNFGNVNCNVNGNGIGNGNVNGNSNGNGFRHFLFFWFRTVGEPRRNDQHFFGMARERRGKNGNGTGTVHRNERITVTLF